eukprot:TRINITY_DN11228_c0_g1_i1.p1 TRINITY_DN11228_c0_g1~~TRINITY_DN11228_c0_g1_i1.p1  ORF type:complete len:242 (+),score=38.19 TRINITY_DN11228_c0_g1_i1:3-728(+)
MGGCLSRIFIKDVKLGNAVWFLKEGGAMLSPYWWAAGITFQIPLLCTVVFCRYSPARHHVWVVGGCGVLLVSAGYFQIMVCTSDPGIIPRQVEKDAERAVQNDRAGEEVMGLLVQPRDQLVKTEEGEMLVYRWCRTCKIHRPPRAAHCMTLDCCVTEYDHFCPVVGSCIAQRTLRYFVGFLTSCALLASWTGGCTYYLLRTSCSPTGPYYTDIRGRDRMVAATSIGCGAGFWTGVMSLFYY